jgi:mRNA degradation ribonuclease J1/J2
MMAINEHRSSQELQREIDLQRENLEASLDSLQAQVEVETRTRLVELDDVDRYERSELIVISTGSQGEPFSALSLLASGEHRRLEVGEGDTVILASSLIPGNEQAVFRNINGLFKRGARVVHSGTAAVHVSGHASRDELVLFHNILEPEYVIPVHGEHRHLRAHAEIATLTGALDDHVLYIAHKRSVFSKYAQYHRLEFVLKPIPHENTRYTKGHSAVL